MIIGGPWAGRMYEGRKARLHLEVMPQYAMVPDERGVAETVVDRTRIEYVFTEMFGVNLWVPRGWSQDDIAREVFTNYRPQALRGVVADDF